METTVSAPVAPALPLQPAVQVAPSSKGKLRSIDLLLADLKK
jgi:hypothetical protein